MRQSQLFIRTAKSAPKDEASINARLLEQGGFIQKLMAGAYTFLPLGNRVLQKIENIVRREMDKISAEILMPGLHPKENWVDTGRWETLDVLFKLKSQHGFEYALGATHEEIIAPTIKKLVSSYRDLPLAYYQIQTKFRDELRAKSGLMRGREFRMKDLYSFHADEADLAEYYKNVQQTYFSIYSQMGIKAILTEASGGSFSKFSHEFQAEVASGEDVIYVCEKCAMAKNKEIFSGPAEACTNCAATTWRETTASEIGNIFKLGTKFTEPIGFTFIDAENVVRPVIMGCYGIGTTRLMGVIAELHNDANGLVWPESIAPFHVHLIAIANENAEVHKEAELLHRRFLDMGIEVLYDDREVSPGAKFADADLIGIPYRIVISAKTLTQESAELKKRHENKTTLIKTKEIASHLIP